MPQRTVKFYLEMLMRAMISRSRKVCELAGTRERCGVLIDPTKKRRTLDIPLGYFQSHCRLDTEGLECTDKSVEKILERARRGCGLLLGKESQ